MAKVAVVGSCMIDFITYSSHLPKSGETIIGYKYNQSYGGKGANQCIAAARLGASTVFITSLGSDSLGLDYLNNLKKEDVDTSHVKLRDNIFTGVAQINVSQTGENTIVVVPGSNSLLCPNDVIEAKEKIQSASVLLCQFEIDLITVLEALKVFKGHGTSIVNGAPALKNINPEILELSDIFCVNETEAETMTEIDNISIENAQTAVDKFFALGCNTIIITFGAKGAVYASKNDRNIKHVSTDVVDAVDTTGAGDAFIGALAFYIAYYADFSIQECIKRANKIATKSVLRTGTQISYAYRKELDDELFF